MVSAPLFACWFGTENNPSVQRDTLRRILPTPLETVAGKPEERSGFRYDPILPHVEEQHPRLAAAALTVLRAYCVAGRPNMQLKPWGSYEGWSALVRGALVWAGQADPALGRQLLVEAADTERTALGLLLEHWRHLDRPCPPSVTNPNEAIRLTRPTPPNPAVSFGPAPSIPERRSRRT